jgi:hypothetical protein
MPKKKNDKKDPKKKTGPASKPAPGSVVVSPDPDLDDKKLLEAVGPVDLSLSPGEGPEVVLGPGDLSLVGSGDAAAAAKAAAGPGKKTKAGSPKDPGPSAAAGSDKKPVDPSGAGGPGVPPEVKALLEPGAIAALVVSVNEALFEKKSPWAAYPKEAKNIGVALETVVDKYFPRAGAWAPELVLAVLLAVYAVPRWKYLPALNKRPAGDVPEGSESKAAGDLGPDERLEDVAA